MVFLESIVMHMHEKRQQVRLMTSGTVIMAAIVCQIDAACLCESAFLLRLGILIGVGIVWWARNPTFENCTGLVYTVLLYRS